MSPELRRSLVLVAAACFLLPGVALGAGVPGAPPAAAPASKEDPDGNAEFEKARQVLRTSRDSDELIEAIATVARSRHQDARAALEEFILNEERVKVLNLRKVVSEGKVLLQFHEAMATMARSDWPSAEDLLLKISNTGAKWMNKGGELAQAARLARNYALGKLKSPGEATYALLAIEVQTFFGTPPANEPSRLAERSLAEIGTDQAKKILRDYFVLRCEKGYGPETKPDAEFVPLYLQWHRDKPAMFELLVEFYQKYPDRKDSIQLIGGLVGEAGHTEGVRDYGHPVLPSYDHVNPGDASRYIKAIDSLLAGSGKERLTDDLKRLVSKLRETMAAKEKAGGKL